MSHLKLCSARKILLLPSPMAIFDLKYLFSADSLREIHFSSKIDPAGQRNCAASKGFELLPIQSFEIPLPFCYCALQLLSTL